jgi:hypothetical protein
VKDIWSDLGQWDKFYGPPPASDFMKVAALMLRAAQHDSSISGFIFNGVILRLQDGDTPESLHERYIA